MTLDEALEAAMLGDRVRASNMQPGSYVDYNFNGWRRNFAGGSSSAFTFTDHDREAEWCIVGHSIVDHPTEPGVRACELCGYVEPKRDSWGRVVGERHEETQALIDGARSPDEVRQWIDEERLGAAVDPGPTRNKWGQPA
jgi:hypothetical protein